jgi:hypothetical protein
MPLDPVAWLVMYGEHQAALADLIAANMRHRLPLEAVRDAPPSPPQVDVSTCGVLCLTWRGHLLPAVAAAQDASMHISSKCADYEFRVCNSACLVAQSGAVQIAGRH